MSEYIVKCTEVIGISGNVLQIPDYIDLNCEIVRCRDCKHYYEAENYHPNGNYVMRCCKYFDAYNDEVEPDGFCAWGELRGEGETDEA